MGNSGTVRRGIERLFGVRAMRVILRELDDLKVGWNGLSMLSKARDITGDGVLSHFPGFGEVAPEGDATRQGRDDGCESTLRFRAEDDIKAMMRLLHGVILSDWRESGQSWSE